MKLTEDIKTTARSMITASHYDNLPEKDFESYLTGMLTEAYTAGRQEVVDWLYKHGWTYGQGVFIEGTQLKAQLEAWGIRPTV